MTTTTANLANVPHPAGAVHVDDWYDIQFGIDHVCAAISAAQSGFSNAATIATSLSILMARSGQTGMSRARLWSSKASTYASTAYASSSAVTMPGSSGAHSLSVAMRKSPLVAKWRSIASTHN